MTLLELKQALDALGLDTRLSDIYDDSALIGDRTAVDDRFCLTVTQAMNEINRIRPRVSQASLRHPQDGKADPADETLLCYDLAALCPDFVSLPPDALADLYGSGVELRDGRVIVLPLSYDGAVFRIPYRRRLRAVTVDTPDTDILDLDDDLCLMLPYLIGSLLFFDEDTAKAQYLRNIYVGLYNDTTARQRSAAPLRVRNLNNWG